MDDLTENFKRAEEIYELGIKMQNVFAKSEDEKRAYMIMAIAAGLKSNLALISNENIGERIKKLRTDKKLTLRQIEDATGISNAYLSLLENGKIIKPSLSAIEKIMNYLVDGTIVEKDETMLATLKPLK